ncbi:MAG: DUF4405 domain-containing protein [Kouleothrix sp.]|nr:DUF4405 domain-containing protein [Kouleothrix sp.]
MQKKTKQPNRNKLNLAIDLAIFLAFLVAMAPRFSGIPIHEWLSIAFGAAIVTHLLLHWQWIIQVAKRFFGKTQWSARINYLLNILLFIDTTVIIFTGLMISQSALPLLGIDVAGGGSWRRLHSLSADFAVFLTGLHVALHWQWIVSMTKRFVIAPLSPSRPVGQLNTPTNRKEV